MRQMVNELPCMSCFFFTEIYFEINVPASSHRSEYMYQITNNPASKNLS